MVLSNSGYVSLRWPGDKRDHTLAWTRAHDIEHDAVYGIPGRVLLLGATGDSRGIPLLRQALESPNPYIENVAALGLAEIQDKASVPFIIEACRKARPDVASAIAQALIYFDDSQAQSAVDTYLPKELAESLREARARGKGPFHS